MNQPRKRGGHDSGGFAKSMYWGSRATSAAMQFVVPALIGLWVDGQYGFSPWGIVVGAVLGFAFGLRELVRLMHQMDKAAERTKNRGEP
ncbi:MAG: AtpZ/AtpI family protein [Planctomycetaceae bacterium]